MATETYRPRLEDAEVAAHNAHISLDTAVTILERRDGPDRDLHEGYSAGQAGKLLREARQRAEKARELLRPLAAQQRSRSAARRESTPA